MTATKPALLAECRAQRDQIAALQANKARLREALYPYLPEHDIAYSSKHGRSAGTRCPCNDCLRASAALAATQGGRS